MNIRGSVYKYAPFADFSHCSAIFQQDSFLGNTVQGQKMIKCGIQRDAWGSVCLTGELGIDSERSSSRSQVAPCAGLQGGSPVKQSGLKVLLPFFTCFPKGLPLGQVYKPSTDLYVSKSWTHCSSRSFLERASCVRLIFPIPLLFEGKPTFPPELLVCLAVSPQVKSISVGFRLSKENGPNDSPQIFPIPFALLYIIYDIFFRAYHLYKIV